MQASSIITSRFHETSGRGLQRCCGPLRGPVSGESTLVASAGHGASYLWRLETWNGSIAITPYDTSCFDVEAAVVVDGPDDAKGNELKYTRKQLRLLP